jgi:hypothetical protein
MNSMMLAMANPQYMAMMTQQLQAAGAAAGSAALPAKAEGSQSPFDSSDTNDKTKSRKNNTNKAKAKKPGQTTGKGGRLSDPRMVAAIEAKTRDKNLSLRDALEAGGFEFPHTEGRCPAANVVDADGVSLAQRNNQVSRRLRQMKEAQAKKGKAGGQDGQSSQSAEEEA